MKKMLGGFFRNFMWACIGAFIGRAGYLYFDYRKRPELYETASAPWYSQLIIPFIVTLVIVVISVCTRIALRKKVKKDSEKPASGTSEKTAEKQAD